MDFRLFVLYISEHYVAVVGTTLALFFTTCMILLIRSIGNRTESEGGGGAVDVTAIEGALKRVLATQPISISARSVGEAAGAGMKEAGDGEAKSGSLQSIEALQHSVAAGEAQIEKLTKELAEARAQTPSGASGGDNTALQDELKIYKAKIEELQARLAEYEIIEDDIADLSMFKEENAKLKEELTQLKAKPQLSVAPAPPAAAKVDPEPEPKFEKADTLALHPEDDVVKQFSAAVEAEGAGPAALKEAAPAVASAPDEDPLAGDLNTNKIISEVESLSADAEAAADTGSALEDLLDTDKLLAEVDSLKGVSSAPSADDDLLASFEKKAAEG